MVADSGRGRVTGLTDRLSERAALGQLVEAVRAGESRALVVRGEPGVGKTALLDYLAGRASVAGLPVGAHGGRAGGDRIGVRRLRQLSRRSWITPNKLPVPQQEALRTGFGLSEGRRGPFPVGLAVLSLLSEVATNGR